MELYVCFECIKLTNVEDCFYVYYGQEDIDTATSPHIQALYNKHTNSLACNCTAIGHAVLSYYEGLQTRAFIDVISMCELLRG
jgi:hypothetical protein